MKNVDLSLKNCGVIELERGAKFFCPIIEPCNDGSFNVRFENGWYNRFTKEGKAISSGKIIKADGSEENVVGRSIVSFIPCEGNDPEAEGLPCITTP